MKKLFILPIYYSLVSIIVPYLVLAAFSVGKTEAPPQAPAATYEDTVSVFNPTDNTTTTMNMTDYLTGVVAAEMPAAFEKEALKAQAVAARTYTMYKASLNEHDADVCTDFAHCQAYITNEEMKKVWGDDFDLYYNKIRDAVTQTEGEHLVYNEEPVMAVFHSMGGGFTENSADVWGEAVPYLVSVESPGEETATNYYSSCTVSFEEFKSKITSAFPEAKIYSPEDVSDPILTDGGHVKSIVIGSVSIPGTKIRTLFNLRSTKFDISFENDMVTFSVTGYGHGVGMSQYGANAMAKEGKSYTEILAHFYRGTTMRE